MGAAHASALNMTSLQFQKQLGLIEARRMIVSSGMPLSQLASEVGYECTSQFRREPEFKKSL